MAVPPPPSDKPALRDRLRAARRVFASGRDEAGLAAAHAALHDRLRPRIAGDGPLAGYAAMGGEPDVMTLLDEAARAERAVALPRIGPDRTMSFATWQPGAALVRGPLGIAQPAETDRVEPAVLLVPLLGFDRRGVRLGQGAGHYDRWCAAHPQALRIGVAWSVQEVAALPVEPWDVPLHAVATEREWIAM